MFLISSQSHTGRAQEAQFLLARRDDSRDNHEITGRSDKEKTSSHVAEPNNGYRECNNCDRRASKCPLSTCRNVIKVLSPTDSVASLGVQDDEHVCLFDSGASNHMVSRKDWIRNWQRIVCREIIFGDGNGVFATHRGTIVLRTYVGGPGEEYELS